MNIYLVVLVVVIVGILLWFYQKKFTDQTKPTNKVQPQPTTNTNQRVNEFVEEEEKSNSSNMSYLVENTDKSLTMEEKKDDLVYFEIGINGKSIGKIMMLLFSDVVPKTCQNFRTLCVNKNNLSYRGCPFHRIVRDFMIQGGDFTNENGTGGMSIYGEKFQDENFDLIHDQPYLLSMANSGPNTNGSQFFITTKETPWLDGKHVVFGKVVDGHKIIDILNEVNTGMSDKPDDDIRILDCGIV